jgi:hypothetical protein
MASTYTTNIRLEKQADGENPNSWGDILNQNVIDLVDQAVAGYQIVSVSGTTPITLTELDGVTDQSRNAALSFDGTLTAETSIIIPSNNKTYFVRNNTSGSFALKIKTLGNTASVLEQGQNIMIATDGTNIYQSSFPTSVSAFTVNSLTALMLQKYLPVFLAQLRSTPPQCQQYLADFQEQCLLLLLMVWEIT